MKVEEAAEQLELVTSTPGQDSNPSTGPAARAEYPRVVLAGFGRRTGAVFFDLMFTSILFLPLDLVGRAGTLLSDNTLVGILVGLAASLTQLVLSLLVQGIMVSRFGSTPGKLLMGLSIVHGTLGVKISMGRAICRELAKILSFLTLCVGYFMVAFRADKRALHDLIVDSVVVYRPRDPLFRSLFR